MHSPCKALAFTTLTSSSRQRLVYLCIYNLLKIQDLHTEILHAKKKMKKKKMYIGHGSSFFFFASLRTRHAYTRTSVIKCVADILSQGSYCVRHDVCKFCYISRKESDPDQRKQKLMQENKSAHTKHKMVKHARPHMPTAPS
jgi:hypothetical protein